MNTGIQPRTAFGRRTRADPGPAGQLDPAPRPARAIAQTLPLLGLTAFLLVAIASLVWTLADIGRMNSASAAAEQKVIAIVNQPVTRLPRSGPVEVFSPGWFHPGATTPDFNTVDIRATQEFPYRDSTYVSSDLNPSEMFLGSELEFNAMTKYFYTDRNLPKKRLSQAEMLDINGLYRVIGRDEQASSRQWLISAVLILAALCAGLALLPSISRALRP